MKKWLNFSYTDTTTVLDLRAITFKLQNINAFFLVDTFSINNCYTFARD